MLYISSFEPNIFNNPENFQQIDLYLSGLIKNGMILFDKNKFFFKNFKDNINSINNIRIKTKAEEIS